MGDEEPIRIEPQRIRLSNSMSRNGISNRVPMAKIVRYEKFDRTVQYAAPLRSFSNDNQDTRPMVELVQKSSSVGKIVESGSSRAKEKILIPMTVFEAKNELELERVLTRTTMPPRNRARAAIKAIKFNSDISSKEVIIKSEKVVSSESKIPRSTLAVIKENEFRVPVPITVQEISKELTFEKEEKVGTSRSTHTPNFNVTDAPPTRQVMTNLQGAVSGAVSNLNGAVQHFMPPQTNFTQPGLLLPPNQVSQLNAALLPNSNFVIPSMPSQAQLVQPPQLISQSVQQPSSPHIASASTQEVKTNIGLDLVSPNNKPLQSGQFNQNGLLTLQQIGQNQQFRIPSQPQLIPQTQKPHPTKNTSNNGNINNNGNAQNVVPGSENYEQRGCVWDFASNSCKDLFNLNWCDKCEDFGSNVFIHDCKCSIKRSNPSSMLQQTSQPFQTNNGFNSMIANSGLPTQTYGVPQQTNSQSSHQNFQVPQQQLNSQMNSQQQVHSQHQINPQMNSQQLSFGMPQQNFGIPQQTQLNNMGLPSIPTLHQNNPPNAGLFA
uniref:RanBP2-type domain-containing protein n=1 Tax=Rhabditophanes sp. KR3021 TaxID=114890 RepID=A0AC35UCK5_9BILA